MTNRRNHFRLSFAELERILVELSGPTIRKRLLMGNLVNISTGGLGIWVNNDPDGITQENLFRITFATPGKNRKFTFDCKVVHKQMNGTICQCGLQFLPLAD